MALIIDPDLLEDEYTTGTGTSVYIDAAAKTIKLNAGQGSLTTDGVTLKALYSFLKEEWKNPTVFVPTTTAVTNKALTSNVATLTTGSAHGLAVGVEITVAGVDATFNGVYTTIAGTTGSTVVYAKTAGDVGSTAASGTVGLNVTKPLTAYPFPMVPITDESFEFVDGWDMDTDTSRYLLRTSGWTVRNTSGNVTQQWAGIIGLGNVEVDDQPYFWQGGSEVATDFQLTGQINQAVQILDDPNGDGNYSDGFDFRAALTLYVREQGQLFGQADLGDIGVTSMAPIAYRFPLSTGADLKVVAADTAIKASGTGYPADTAPYSGMTITYSNSPVSETGLTGGSYNFGIIIDANGQTLQKAYEFVQYALRQNADINADTPSIITGKIAEPLLYYVGDTLYTQAAINPDGGGTGVFVENFDAGDLNSVIFVDNTGTERQYPYSATLTLQFNSNLVSDGAAQYWVYFTNDDAGSNLGYDWGTANAIIVQDSVPANMVGSIAGASVTKTYDYDGNVQRGGGSSGVDAPITVVGIGLTTGQYVRATGTIQRSKSNVVALVAPLERNYENP